MSKQSDGNAKSVGKGGWAEVSKSEPCEICDSDHWCTRNVDGRRCCMRIKSDTPMRNGGWLHRGDAPTVVVERPRERRITDTELANRFGPLARACYVKQGGAIMELAGRLGVTTDSLDRLHVGFDGLGWTFPEQNHRGQVIGINRRFSDGGKVCYVGSRRGLTYADDWADAGGPILLVEGGSDVAAGVMMGLCVVGRPSNTGGVEYLIRLLGRHTDRKIVILAERDEKDRSILVRHDSACRCCGQCFSGKFGAVETSKRLSRKLERIVQWTFLPDGAKDLRAWVNRQKAEPNNSPAMERLGHSLLRRIEHGIKR